MALLNLQTITLWISLETMDQWLYGRTVTVRWAKDSRDEYTLEDAIADGCGDISNWKEDEDKDEDEDEDEDGS
ncbi:hypothetical protein HanRHA438_Chr09g0401781 [Helianthus annuus]|nr:hypothetical protein HanRHA438_Chr09g0401781 [Helianthus annuus]